MKLQIFDVGAGACALLTGDNNSHMMIDCGSNADGWQPGKYLTDRGIQSIDMLTITNYDEDHARGAPDLFDRVGVQWLLRNPSVTSRIIGSLKSDTGMGPGITRLFHEIDTKFSGVGGASTASPPDFGGVERRTFFVEYPTFDDENNLSLVLFLKYHGVGIMFPGDLEGPGFSKLLEQAAFRQALAETNLYVASHHGRESGCSEEAFALMKSVRCVVISDKGYQHETQETYNRYYRLCGDRGVRYKDEIARRYVLTTRRDGMISFAFDQMGGWYAY